jgi:hypothetical protein
MPTASILLGGEITTAEKPESFNVDLEVSDIPSLPPSREVTAKISVYLSDNDVVREFRIKGVTGEIVEWEPTIEERLLVAACQAAELLREEGLDMHDFKEIVFAALLRLEQERLKTGEKSDVYDRLDNIYYKLGGMD